MIVGKIAKYTGIVTAVVILGATVAGVLGRFIADIYLEKFGFLDHGFVPSDYIPTGILFICMAGLPMVVEFFMASALKKQWEADKSIWKISFSVLAYLLVIFLIEVVLLYIVINPHNLRYDETLKWLFFIICISATFYISQRILFPQDKNKGSHFLLLPLGWLFGLFCLISCGYSIYYFTRSIYPNTSATFGGSLPHWEYASFDIPIYSNSGSSLPASGTIATAISGPINLLSANIPVSQSKKILVVYETSNSMYFQVGDSTSTNFIKLSDVTWESPSPFQTNAEQ